MPSREGPYKTRLKKKIQRMFPDCVILRLDSDDQQGIPDLLILFGNKWAVLEVKISESAPIQPNQEYWIEHLGTMSFAYFIYPAIEEDVLNELHQAFQPCGYTCLSERK